MVVVPKPGGDKSSVIYLNIWSHISNLFPVCLLLASLITGGDLSLPGQRVVALALIYDMYKVDNPFGSLFLHLLEGKPGLLPLAPQERLFIGQIHNFIPANIKDVSIIIDYIINYFANNGSFLILTTKTTILFMYVSAMSEKYPSRYKKGGFKTWIFKIIVEN